jgi:hypothetical protein
LSIKFECILFEQRGIDLSANVKVDSTTINLKRAVLDIENLRKHRAEPYYILTTVNMKWFNSTIKSQELLKTTVKL